MKILIICSKAFYKDIAPIKEKLESMGQHPGKKYLHKYQEMIQIKNGQIYGTYLYLMEIKKLQHK